MDITNLDAVRVTRVKADPNDDRYAYIIVALGQKRARVVIASEPARNTGRLPVKGYFHDDKDSDADDFCGNGPVTDTGHMLVCQAHRRIVEEF